jgi:hypothetical protein
METRSASLSHGQLARIQQYAKGLLVKAFGVNTGMRVFQRVLRIEETVDQAEMLALIIKDLRDEDKQLTRLRDHPLTKYKSRPVGIREFISSPLYMNKGGSEEKPIIYPLVMDELEEINSGKYVEVVFTGGIGSGKSTGALYTVAYQLYILSLMENPHRAFDLDPSSEILFIMQSITAQLAKEVDYARFRDMVLEAPYFVREFPCIRPDLESKLVFKNRIEVRPVAGTETGAIGQNVIGGLIDELNYMAVIDKSSRNVDAGGYDQAVALYNSIARRRKSRFMSQGSLPGILCLVSSKRFPGQFTDTKEEEAKTDETIYIYDKRTWEIAPHRYSGETFRIYVGDQSRRARFLEPNEKLHPDEEALVMNIPVEHKTDFEKDIINALREVAGVATLARHPFIMRTEAITEAMTVSNRVSADATDFDRYKIALRRNWPNKNQPRFAHVDLGLSSDHAGIAIGHVPGFQTVEHGPNLIEIMPIIQIDMVLNVAPPVNGEINFEKIRDVFYILRDKLKVPLRWVSYDSWQSVDSLQLLRSKGFVTGTVSVDKTSIPYDITKTALYQGRLLLPKHARLQKELASLERDPMTGKIDHPPAGSKDCADAVAGVTYGLTLRREIWAQHNIPVSQIPGWLMGIGGKDKMASNATT